MVEVTTYTLAIAVSREVQLLPKGTLWMIVTPGLNAVASSNNATLIGSLDINIMSSCTKCAVKCGRLQLFVG